MEENITGVAGEASVGAADQQVSTDTTQSQVDTVAEVSTHEEQQSQQPATESVPDGSKPSKAWETYRKKAELADKQQAMIDKIVNLGLLPDGFNSWAEFEEFVDSQNGEAKQEQVKPIEPDYVPATQQPDIKSTVKQIIAEQYQEEQRTQAENMYLLKNLDDVVEKYPEYKGEDGLCDISKLPQDELMLFYQALKAGNRKVNLLNLVRGSRYDTDTAKAKQEGEVKAAAHVKSTAHTTQVVGNTAPAPVEHIEISPALQKNFELAGIKDPAKQREYAAKFQGTTNYKGTYNAPR